MSVVKVYGLQLSTCTRRVTMCLEEKGIPYELIKVDILAGEQKVPDFLAKQPFGQIPVFEDGNIRIIESRAICRYICNKWASQGTDLLGKDAAAQAATDSWLEIESNHFNGPASKLKFEKFFKSRLKLGDADEAIVAAQLEKLDKVLAVYEARLKTQAHLGGTEFSLADLSHLPYATYLTEAGLAPFDKYPAVKAWWEKISVRPAWVKLSA